MADLNPLVYGHVVGRFLALVGDSVDALENPDAAPMVGTVTFTPSIPYALVANGVPTPATVLPRPIVVTLNVDGEIEWNGLDGIYLPATDDPNLNPTDFTWQAAFDISYEGVVVPYGPINFQLPNGTEVDLTLVAPVASSPGTLTIVGPPGPSGSALPVASDAEAQAMTLDTKTITPLRLGAAATSAATADRLIRRDGSGRAQVADPSAAADIATKGYADGVAFKTYADATALANVTTSETGYITGDGNTLFAISSLSGYVGKWTVDSQFDDWGGGVNSGELTQVLMGASDIIHIRGWSFYRRRTMSGGVWGAWSSWTQRILSGDISGPPGGTGLWVPSYQQSGTASWYRRYTSSWDGTTGNPPSDALADNLEMETLHPAAIGIAAEQGFVLTSNNAAPTGYGMPAATITGTGTNFNVTNRAASARGDRYKRYDYVAASASTTAVAGVVYNINVDIANGFVIRFRVAAATGLTSNTRFFAGLTSTAVSMTDAQPSAIVDMIGVGYDSADTNIQWMSNDSSGTASKSATSLAVSTTSSEQLMDVWLWCTPGSSTIRGRLDIVGGGTHTTDVQSFSSNIPASTTGLQFTMRISAGGTSAQPAASLYGLEYGFGYRNGG